MVSNTVSLIAIETMNPADHQSFLVGRYIRSFGGRVFIATVAIFTIGAQAMDIVLPTWLSVWSQAYTKDQETLNLGFFIGIFTGIERCKRML